MIVTAKPPKRLPPRKPARSRAALNPPMKVVAAESGSTRQVVDDPEADARVAAFFKRAIQPS